MPTLAPIPAAFAAHFMKHNPYEYLLYSVCYVLLHIMGIFHRSHAGVACNTSFNNHIN